MNINIVFIIAMAILAFNIFLGWRRGFISMIFKMLIVIVAIALAVAFMPTGAKLLKKTPLYDKVYVSIEEKIDEQVEGINTESVVGQMQAINKLKLPSFVKEAMAENNNAEIRQAMGVQHFTEYAAGYLANMVMNGISFIIIFILAIIALKIIEHLLNLVAKLPVLHGFNKIGGILLGALMGFAVLWVCCIVLSVLSGTNLGGYIAKCINENAFLSWIYNNNYLVAIVTGMGRILF